MPLRKKRQESGLEGGALLLQRFKDAVNATAMDGSLTLNDPLRAIASLLKYNLQTLPHVFESLVLWAQEGKTDMPADYIDFLADQKWLVEDAAGLRPRDEVYQILGLAVPIFEREADPVKVAANSGQKLDLKAA